VKHTPMHHRHRERGAAMAEAIIAISTMLIFMGLISWTRQAYGMKLDLQQRTRSDTFYFASHGCDGGGGGAPGGSPEAEAAAGKSPLPDKAAVKQTWGSASGAAGGSASWQAVWDQNAHGGNASINYGKLGLNANVTAGSTVTCNEKKYNSQLTAWFQFGVDYLKSGAGVLDLFN